PARGSTPLRRHARRDAAARMGGPLGHPVGAPSGEVRGRTRSRRGPRREDEAGRRQNASLRLNWEAGDRPSVARLLHQQASLAVAEGRLARGARLFGAAEALRVALGMRILPMERAQHEAEVDAARRQLDAAASGQAWADGRRMGLEQAIAYGLGGGS